MKCIKLESRVRRVCGPRYGSAGTTAQAAQSERETANAQSGPGRVCGSGALRYRGAIFQFYSVV